MEKDEKYPVYTVEQAGLIVLYTIMLIDGDFDEREFYIIMEFLKSENIRKSALINNDKPHFKEANLIAELNYLKNLTYPELINRFRDAVSFLKEDAENTGDRDNLISIYDFARKLILADNIITHGEKSLFDSLAKEWNMK